MLLDQLTLRVTQRAEYPADSVAARAGSTEAAVGLMDRLLVAESAAAALRIAANKRRAARRQAGRGARGRAEPPRHALRLRATDTGRSWTHGPGEPVAEISGKAERLLLMLRGRVSAADASIPWSGDRAAGVAVLVGPLTP